MTSNRKKGERFAKLPLELLMHPAVTTLPHAAFRVLAVIAAGYRGDNNGLLACTDTWMRRFGIVSRDTTYTAIHALIERGLIEVTRRGIKHRKVATHYAITWQALNYRDDQMLGRFPSPAHAYRQWQAPERTKKKVPDRRKHLLTKSAEFQSDGRTSTSPMVGPQNAALSPTSPAKTGVIQSDDREYLRLSAGFSKAISPQNTDPLSGCPVSASGNAGRGKLL